MGGVLGHPRSHGFRNARMGLTGYNDKIVPTELAKQAPEALRLWRRFKLDIQQINPLLDYTSVQVNRKLRGPRTATGTMSLPNTP